MRVRIKRKQLRDLIEIAASSAKDGGKEVCGLLIDTGYFLELIRLRNKTKKGGSFGFYAKEICGLEKAVSHLNYKVVGSFHSHPLYFAKPGEGDLSNSEDDDLMLIIDCVEKKADLWKIKRGKANRVKYEVI
jgi:proteasome lid subunit RPN8/RPN11